ncbi:1173_t:CDS:2, partial [Entrophospora sp. SA101]
LEHTNTIRTLRVYMRLLLGLQRARSVALTEDDDIVVMQNTKYESQDPSLLITYRRIAIKDKIRLHTPTQLLDKSVYRSPKNIIVLKTMVYKVDTMNNANKSWKFGNAIYEYEIVTK